MKTFQTVVFIAAIAAIIYLLMVRTSSGTTTGNVKPIERKPGTVMAKANVMQTSAPALSNRMLMPSMIMQ